MRDLHLLWLGRNDEYRMTSHMRYLRKEAERRVKVTKYGWKWPGFTARDALIPVEKYKPDAVFIAHYYDWVNLDKVDIPKLAWWSDPHTHTARRIAWANEGKIDAVLHCCYGGKSKGMEYLEPVLSARSVLFPHSVDVDIVKDYNMPKIYDALVVGRSGRGIYPLRYRMRLVLESLEAAGKYKVKWQRRPKVDYGWTEERLKLRELVAGESYAKLIGQSKVVPFGTSSYRYPVAKIFEVMATNTLAMFGSPYNPELFHLVPDENFVEVDKDNFRDKFIYYVENDVEREKIAQKGYDMVQKHHSTKVRITQLIKLIEEELG